MSLLTTWAFAFKIIGILCCICAATIAAIAFLHEMYMAFKRRRSKRRAKVVKMEVYESDAVEIMN